MLLFDYSIICYLHCGASALRVCPAFVASLHACMVCETSESASTRERERARKRARDRERVVQQWHVHFFLLFGSLKLYLCMYEVCMYICMYIRMIYEREREKERRRQSCPAMESTLPLSFSISLFTLKNSKHAPMSSD